MRDTFDLPTAADEPQSLTISSIIDLLQSYPSYVSPQLEVLDQLRFKEIPDRLAERKEKDDFFLEKSEVTVLVEWKLKHGTYRPKLASLVASNSDEDILSTTKSAFELYEEDNNAHIDAIKTLIKLKGIGPATASLLLSCYDPAKVPFFSDEFFRYATWTRAKGQGWDRKIKYTLSEYEEMYEKSQKLLERLQTDGSATVTMLELEKAAYVLGKEAQSNTKRHVDDDDDEEKDQKDPQENPKSRKRKGHSDAPDSTELKVENPNPSKRTTRAADRKRLKTEQLRTVSRN